MARWDAVLAVLIDSFTGLFHNRPAQAAASIAYYFLFSIFPLFLFMVIFISYFVDVNTIQQELVTFLQGVLPGSEKLVIENLQNLLANRTSTSLLASVSLLWSGSGMFNGIISNIQKAWPETRERGYFINRALAIVGIFLLLLAVTVLMTFSIVFNVSDALAFFNIELNPTIQFLISIFTNYIFPILFLYMIAFLLYHSIPTADVNRQAARIGALTFAIAMHLFTTLFGKYVLSPMNRYDLIYGSVTTIVILLLYIYFSAFIILYPAYLTAALTHYYRRKEKTDPLVKASGPEPKQIAVKPEKKKKTKKEQPNRLPDVPLLDDPVILADEQEKAKKKDIWKTIWEFVKSLFRWK